MRTHWYLHTHKRKKRKSLQCSKRILIVNRLKRLENQRKTQATITRMLKNKTQNNNKKTLLPYFYSTATKQLL